MRQAELLRELGAQPVVLAVDDEHHAEDRWRLAGAEIVLAPGAGPRALAFAPLLARRAVAARLDLLHLHGVWHGTTLTAQRWAKATGRPLVISPHGMFDPWITGRRRWKKALARALWERRGWQAAACFHALTGGEAADIAREAGPVPVTVVPNPAPAVSAAPPRPRPPMALYLGRIHPKKNLPALVSGWRRALPDLPPGAVLTIAGWGDEAGVAQLEQALGADAPSIEVVGTAFGSQKAALFDIARFAVLPSLSEGLPMAMLEAWAAGVPTVMSKACHLPEGFAAGAAIACGEDADSIAAALRQAFGQGESEWLAMARAARALAAGPFSPQQVGARWLATYAGLLAGGEPQFAQL